MLYHFKRIFSIQVFLKPRDGNLVPLLPVVSSLIKDKRAHPDLNIVDISDDTSPVEGMYQQIFHFFYQNIVKIEIRASNFYYDNDSF